MQGLRHRYTYAAKDGEDEERHRRQNDGSPQLAC